MLDEGDDARFNSLFIGIGFAILFDYPNPARRWLEFQFPFHRDRLCNGL